MAKKVNKMKKATNIKNQAKGPKETQALEIRPKKNEALSDKKQEKTTKRKPSKITRIPRPLGITVLSKTYNNAVDNQAKYNLKQRLLDYYITIYLQQSYQINQKPESLQSVSQHLGITYIDMMKRISRIWRALGQDLGNPETMKEVSQGLMAQVMELGLSDRSRIMAQYHTLYKAQGDAYVPFLSKELNGTLKLLLESQKPLLELLKVMSPTGPQVQVNNHSNTQNNTTNNTNIFTPQQAIGLLEASNLTNLLGSDKEDMLGQLASHYLNDVPNVLATAQESEHDKALLKKPNGLKSIDDSHENHRAKELGIDEDIEIVE